MTLPLRVLFPTIVFLATLAAFIVALVNKDWWPVMGLATLLFLQGSLVSRMEGAFQLNWRGFVRGFEVNGTLSNLGDGTTSAGTLNPPSGPPPPP